MQELFDSGWGLSLIVFIPVLGAVVIAFIPRSFEAGLKWTALVTSGIALVLAGIMVWLFDFSAADEFQFGADVSLPNTLHGQMLRSPHAHAKIVSIDTHTAQSMPGVLAVVTADDFPPLRPRGAPMAHLPCSPPTVLKGVEEANDS